MSFTSVTVAILCLIGMSGSGLVATLTSLQMIDELNKTRAADRRIAAVGWRANFQRYEALAEYRRLHPDSPLLRRLKRSSVCGLAAVTVMAGLLQGLPGAVWLGVSSTAIAWFTWRITRPRTS
jgi:hypothetical protein